MTLSLSEDVALGTVLGHLLLLHRPHSALRQSDLHLVQTVLLPFSQHLSQHLVQDALDVLRVVALGCPRAHLVYVSGWQAHFPESALDVGVGDLPAPGLPADQVELVAHNDEFFGAELHPSRPHVPDPVFQLVEG